MGENSDGETGNGAAERIDELAQEALEIGIGALLLGLRRVNVLRRELVESTPAAKPVVDAILEGVEAAAGPISQGVGTALGSVADAVPGEQGARLQIIAGYLSDSGPELLRLSGLTKRD